MFFKVISQFLIVLLAQLSIAYDFNGSSFLKSHGKFLVIIKNKGLSF